MTGTDTDFLNYIFIEGASVGAPSVVFGCFLLSSVYRNLIWWSLLLAFS